MKVWIKDLKSLMVVCCIMLCLIFLSVPTYAQNIDPPERVTIGGVYIDLDEKPFMMNDQVYLPIACIAEKVGYTVEQEADTFVIRYNTVLDPEYVFVGDGRHKVGTSTIEYFDEFNEIESLTIFRNSSVLRNNHVMMTMDMVHSIIKVPMTWNITDKELNITTRNSEIAVSFLDEGADKNPAYAAVFEKRDQLVQAGVISKEEQLIYVVDKNGVPVSGMFADYKNKRDQFYHESPATNEEGYATTNFGLGDLAVQVRGGGISWRRLLTTPTDYCIVLVELKDYYQSEK